MYNNMTMIIQKIKAKKGTKDSPDHSGGGGENGKNASKPNRSNVNGGGCGDMREKNTHQIVRTNPACRKLYHLSHQPGLACHEPYHKPYQPGYSDHQVIRHIYPLAL